MPLVIIILIIIVIAFVYAILRLILTAFFGFLFLLSTNALLFIEKCFFISNAIPPWVTWGIFGLFIGLLLAAYKSASHYRYRHLRPFFIVLPILVLVGLGSYNANRLREPLEKTTRSGYQKASQPKRYSSSGVSSQKKLNQGITTVAPDRWKGEYFNNDNLQGSPSMIRDEGNGFIDADWGNKGPCNWKDNFSVRWTRTVSFDDGTYRFVVTSDDGVRLYIDDQLKLGRWNDQEATTYTTDVQLPAGKHTIRLEYYENVGDAIAKLSWQLVSTPKQLVAQSPITYKLTGEWDGKVDDKKATFKITQDGNSLSGNIVYGNVTEFLSGEINNDQVILKGTGYTAKGVTGFSLDTFQGMVSKDVNSINGNYTDEGGHSGTWFAKRKTTILTQESTANQNKKQQSKDNYEPKPAIPAQQFRLTDALRKRPFVVVETQRKVQYKGARMEFKNNGVIRVFTDENPNNRGWYMSLEFSWSPDKSAYSGTWSDSRRVCGGIKLWPIYDSEGDVKCFTGYMEQGRGDRNTIIKVKNTFCLCPDPPDHNPSTRDQYRKPKSPSVHTYETNRSYHWGK